MAIWEYIHGFAGIDRPESITFYDHQDQALYRDVALKIIGQHGWELVSVIMSQDPETRESRYEYFFKRNREDGYPAGFGRAQGN
ncbi:MAG: hypothetical protein EA398_11835 [Deltaproteobacteria bacterium]|nr:MAG: hypothetical protein EA398_11835 [Deltaproteobacteria bacterium]